MRGQSSLIASSKPSPLRRQGSSDFALGLRVWRFRDLAAYAAGVPPSCRRSGHFSLLAQRKVTQRKGTPVASPADKAGRSVSVGRAFRRGSCPDEKESASCRFPLRGLIVRPSPPLKGARRSKASSQSRRLVPLLGTSRRGRALRVRHKVTGRNGSPLGGEFFTAVGKRSVRLAQPQGWESMAPTLSCLRGGKA